MNLEYREFTGHAGVPSSEIFDAISQRSVHGAIPLPLQG